jgi:uncharacterized protein (TIGR02687 family)
MIVEKIQHSIKADQKNLVFYFDADGSVKEELSAIEEAGIKVIEVNNNFFQLKYQLEYELSGQQVFVYHNYPKPNGAALKKYPLLDLLKANTELRLDDVSEFLGQYQLPGHMEVFIKPYIKQLKTKTNQKKLAKILDAQHLTEDTLKRGLISIALDFSTVASKNECIAKLLVLSTQEPEFAKAIKALEEQELLENVQKWLKLLVDESEEITIDFIKRVACKLKYNYLTQLIDHTVKEDSYGKLKLNNPADVNRVQAFFNDWKENKVLSNSLDEVLTDVAAAVDSLKVLKWYGPQEDYGYYSEQMVAEIIQGFYATVQQNPVQVSEECGKWLRPGFTTEANRLQVQFIDYVAKAYSVLAANSGFNFHRPEEFIEAYKNELYKVDYYYRKALVVFDDVQDKLFEYEEKAKELHAAISEKYDRFLIDLNVKWQTALKDIQFNYEAIKVDKQYNFYTDNIRSFNNKLVVIISDALRYELGQELYEDLLSESKNNVAIEPCLASIPSYTNLGMSNLLPNTGLELEKGDGEMVFKINGISTASTNRAAILQAAEAESDTIDFVELKRMDKTAKRAFFRKNRITYVYHDRVDAMGDKRRTEHQTFEAGVKALDDLKWMIRNISGEMSIPNIMITADHGFIYNYNELPEANREDTPKTTGFDRKHIRFVVADEFESEIDGYQFPMRNTTNIDTDLKIAIPRATNRYRRQGSGIQFVHGGASMQELLTPVIKYYKHKTEILKTVSFKRIDSVDKITSGSLKLQLLQDEAVSNRLKAVEVVFGLYGDDGKLLSNEVEVNFNSVSSNPRERFYEAILYLTTAGSKATYCHLRGFDKKDNSKLNPVGVNEIIKISSLMEKDEF